MSVLVVAAHPDDEILGCGATIHRLTADGTEVHILILGEGATSRYSQRSQESASAVGRLSAQAHEAGTIVGASSVTVHNFPDNRFDTIALLEIVKVIEEHIERTRPTQMFVQHGGDVNVDHQRAYQAVLAATRPLPDESVREVLSFEVASSTEWAFGHLQPRFSPTIFYDVSDHLDAKVTALACYTREVRQAPHPRSVESIRALAAQRGASIGVAAAEAFTLVRSRR